MTITKLINGITNGEIYVKFGRAWLDLYDPKLYLLGVLKQYKEDAVIDSERERTGSIKGYFEKTHQDGPDTLTIDEQGVMRFGMFDLLKLHSYITNEDYLICMVDGTVVFKFHVRGENRMSEPIVEDSIEKVLSVTIDVPSKKMIFVNSFPKDISPDMENPYDNENSLCGLVGRRNWAKHYENLNVMYGQTTNTSVSIWRKEGGGEILVTESWLEDNEFFPEDWEENEREEMLRFEEEHKEKSRLLAYLRDNNFHNMGKISCGVWRWEGTDYEHGKVVERMKEDKKNGWEYMDVVVVPVDGSVARMEHYYDSLVKSELGEGVYSRIWID